MYTYHNPTKNGVSLHVIETNASNIRAIQLLKMYNLKGSNEYGINGGWFTSTVDDGNYNILNIAVTGGRPVGGGTYMGEPRNGSINKVGRHAVYYDGNNLDYRQADNYEQLPNVKDNSRAWAQGGVGMSLGNSNWVSIVNSAVDVDSSHTGLSAIVINRNTKKVNLIATTQTVTYVQFRGAIQSYLGITDSSTSDNSTWKGLFLDGGASTQLRCAEVEVTTARKLCQVLILDEH